MATTCLDLRGAFYGRVAAWNSISEILSLLPPGPSPSPRTLLQGQQRARAPTPPPPHTHTAFEYKPSFQARKFVREGTLKNLGLFSTSLIKQVDIIYINIVIKYPFRKFKMMKILGLYNRLFDYFF